MAGLFSVYVIDVYKLTPSNGPKERSRRARDLTVASDNLSAIEFRPDSEGLLLMDIMPHGTTINSDAYVATLKKLQARLSRVRRHREKQDVLLLHDNAQPYVSHKATDQIRKFG
ncbi:hypothetical protein ANN_23223 [Periplaneta americana]|uniref:Mariner Mos1 transposase n=1 Tax=Periplaneta americana TaxID=6978 RepID=A0ABQ8SKX8_PERAM|nr:hypothetical protein ANN_23223 [Periplaneta americana]